MLLSQTRSREFIASKTAGARDPLNDVALVRNAILNGSSETSETTLATMEERLRTLLSTTKDLTFGSNASASEHDVAAAEKVQATNGVQQGGAQNVGLPAGWSIPPNPSTMSAYRTRAPAIGVFVTDYS